MMNVCVGTAWAMGTIAEFVDRKLAVEFAIPVTILHSAGMRGHLEQLFLENLLVVFFSLQLFFARGGYGVPPARPPYSDRSSVIVLLDAM